MGFPGGSAVKNLPAIQETQETQVQSLGREDPLEEGMVLHFCTLAWRIPWMEEPSGLQSIESHWVEHYWSYLASSKLFDMFNIMPYANSTFNYTNVQKHFLVTPMVKNLPAMQETQVHALVVKISWRRKWQPTQICLPGEFQGQRNLEGYCLWDHKESNTTDWLMH